MTVLPRGLPRAVAAFVFFAAYTTLWFSILLLALPLKLIPLAPFQRAASWIGMMVGDGWVACHDITLALTNDVKWEITGDLDLDKEDWYLVIANHQAWTDVVVLFKVFHNRIPFLKFFLKKELIFVPVIGQACWIMDMPFMKRYSREYLRRHPEKKGDDLETTRAACEKFRKIPMAVMNFVEGTRFSARKHAEKNSPYKRLLRPKAAGAAFVLAALGGKVSTILDVTVAYPGGARELWGFLKGEVPLVRVHVEKIPVTDEFRGDYFSDEEYRAGFQSWLNDLWERKDERIERMLSGSDG